LKPPVSCILLAAGLSRRMGTNKLLLPYGGNTVVRFLAGKLLQAGFAEIVAVTGHEREKVEAELATIGIRCVHNERYLSGMHSSIQAGFRALSAPAAGVMICLGDQPALPLQEIRLLIEAFQSKPESFLVYPASGEKRGNPVIISSSLKGEVLSAPDSDRGCSYLFARYPAHAVVMASEACLFDVDEPEQYQRSLRWT
jgi:molybdenum cofactor cytidylyltransferase